MHRAAAVGRSSSQCRPGHAPSVQVTYVLGDFLSTCLSYREGGIPVSVPVVGLSVLSVCGFEALLGGGVCGHRLRSPCSLLLLPGLCQMVMWPPRFP